MALRNQPYIPLYVNDWLTDEKLNMCSIAAQGTFIKLMCIFHKSNEYGAYTLNAGLFKQNDKQEPKHHHEICLKFAAMFARLLPLDKETIADGLIELVEYGVLTIDGNKIFSKRMVKDGFISEQRANAGKKGGGNPNLSKKTDENLFKQKDKQNTEYEYASSIDTDIDIDLNINKGVAIKKNDWFDLDQKKWVEDNCPTLLTMTKPLTNEGLNKLISEFGMTKVEDKLIAMENVPTLRKKYKDAYVTARSWCKKDNKDTRSTTEKLRDAEIANELNPSKCFNIYTGEYEYTNNKFNTNR